MALGITVRHNERIRMNDDEKNETAPLEAAIRSGDLRTIELTNAAMRLREGKLVIKAKELLPQPEGGKKKPKAGTERVAKFEAKKRAEGAKQRWVPPALLEVIEDVEGIENLAPVVIELRAKLEAAETRAKEAEQRAALAEARLRKLPAWFVKWLAS